MFFLANLSRSQDLASTTDIARWPLASRHQRHTLFGRKPEVMQTVTLAAQPEMLYPGMLSVRFHEPYDATIF